MFIQRMIYKILLNEKGCSGRTTFNLPKQSTTITFKLETKI